MVNRKRQIVNISQIVKTSHVDLRRLRVASKITDAFFRDS